MIRVYYNDTQSIVGVEHARQLVQGKKHISSRKRDLSYVVESLLIAGWEENK